MSENEGKSISLDDPEGPGRTIRVKVEPLNIGARINRNSKKFASFGFSIVAVLIFTGIALSGHQKTNDDEKNGAGASSTEQVGQAPPPSPPIHPTTPLNSFTPGGAGAVSAPAAASVGAPGSALNHRLNNPKAPGLNGGQQAPLSEKQKYRQWLISQHYKDLEGSYLSAQSANDAGFGEQNAGLQQVAGAGQGAPRTNDFDPLAAIRAAQAAALPAGSGQIDPGLLAQLKGQGPGANPQQQNKAFLSDQKKGDGGYLHAGIEEALGKHELLAGSIIPAVLITAIDSDLPGVVTAMVRQTVYDTLHPDLVVIPQGAKLIGQYSSDVAYGQRRALIAWNRVIFPNGSMLDLEGMLGTDGQGQSGFADQVDNHYLKIFGSSVLISLLGTGAQLSQPQNAGAFNTPTASQQATAALAQGLDNTGTQLLQKNLGIQSTIRIRAGYLFNVMVNRTMILPVYSPQ